MRMSATDMLNNYYCATRKRVETYELCQRALYQHYFDSYLIYNPGYRAPRNSPIPEDRGEHHRFRSARFEEEQMAWTLVRGPPTGIPTVFNAEEAAIYIQAQSLRSKIVKDRAAARQEEEDEKAAKQLQNKLNKPPKGRKPKGRSSIEVDGEESHVFDGSESPTTMPRTTTSVSGSAPSRQESDDLRELRNKFTTLQRSFSQLQQAGRDSSSQINSTIEELKSDMANRNFQISTLTTQSNSFCKSPFLSSTDSMSR